MTACRLLVLLLLASHLLARGPVYVVLWFDTEDYIEPAADDAALRIANDLTALDVRATFKIVGEKARTLESRRRTDVIQALSKHAIGFHSNWHSLHPAPAEYLRRFGYLEGADEFQRREEPGLIDIKRIFGVPPVCYGQPGSSWGPQSNLALRRMGIPVYLDEGEQVGLNEQPFWYGGLLYVFNMGRNQLRADLNAGDQANAVVKEGPVKAKRLAVLENESPFSSGLATGAVVLEIAFETFKKFLPCAGSCDEDVAAVGLVADAPQIAERAERIQGTRDDRFRNTENVGEAAHCVRAGSEVDEQHQRHLSVGKIGLARPDIIYQGVHPAS